MRGPLHVPYQETQPLFVDPRTGAVLSRGDYHALEQIISLYVDSVLEHSIAIKQSAAYLKVPF